MADATVVADEAPAAPKKKSLLIAIAAAVLLLGGAAGAAAYMFGGRDETASDAKQKKAQVPKGPAIYVKFDPPFVVNFEAKGVMRFLQVSIEVMTRDPATADVVKMHDPRLRNELLLLLGNQGYETISTREGKERLRAEALQAVIGVINSEGGEGKKVEQLYFTSFVMQ